MLDQISVLNAQQYKKRKERVGLLFMLRLTALRTQAMLSRERIMNPRPAGLLDNFPQKKKERKKVIFEIKLFMGILLST